jgi:hypothetical protein
MRQVAGMSEHRLKDNPIESRFSKLWKEWNRDGRTTLAHLLNPHPENNMCPPDPLDRDAVVAATVVQWLGSPVGQGFLEEAGFVARGTHEPKHRPATPAQTRNGDILQELQKLGGASINALTKLVTHQRETLRLLKKLNGDSLRIPSRR